ncbi:MAG: LacI family DNA-binding transcriptional regulator, partial [Ruminococcus sp.]
MSKLVRMSDIAQRLHISTVTVSKALSGKDGVSDALRLKIQQTAEQMGYQRKTIQAERSNRFTVAVLIERYHVNRKNSFSWTIYEGLLTALEIRGHTGKLEDVPASDVERGILPESIQQH